jgi:hypothetical protein
MKEEEKYEPFDQSKNELNWFLQANPDVVAALKRMKVKITTNGQLVRVNRGGCPFGPGCTVSVPDPFGDVIQKS